MKSWLRIVFVLFIYVFLMGSLKAQRLTFDITGYSVKYRFYSSDYSPVFATYGLDSAGLRHGEITIRKQNGFRDTVLVFYGTFEHGVLVDTAYWYYDNKLLKRKAGFSGNATKNDRIPFMEFEKFALAGSLEGPCYSYDSYKSAAKLVKVENYHLGKKNGKETKYYYDGSVHEEMNYVNDLLDGSYRAWTTSHLILTEGNYQNDRKEGKWKYYHQSGYLQQLSSYKNGLGTDTTFYYFANGKTSSYVCMRDGYRCGDFMQYDSLGNKLLYRHYDPDGRMDSVEIGYYPSGQKSFEAHYEAGRMSGLYTSWYSNGKADSTGQMAAGEMIKQWKYYDRNGKLLKVLKKPVGIEIGIDRVGMIDQAMELMDVSTGPIERVPVIPALYIGEVPDKKDKLKFLKHYKQVDLDVCVDNSGNVKWRVVSVMKTEERTTLEAYLNRSFKTATPMKIDYHNNPVVIHMKMNIAK